ncbi:hypothetical protein M9Y10_028922 [Tritrichomonas musculus]|uniref:Right handed beta helix domain-containing protein n=1 Tax=Tritrichomonas musculus TaxID=1915356 RepID=A0ABR2KLB9_9EUKA
MDDLPHLISMLQAAPPPLTPDEEAIIARVTKELEKNNLTDPTGKDKCSAPPFDPIKEPPPFSGPVPVDQSSTVFQTQNLIYVGPNGHFPTIGAAVNQAPEDSTIVIQAGVYEDDFTCLKPIHIISNGEVTLKNTHIAIRTQLVTIYGINFISDTEIFSINRGQLSLSDCSINISSQKPPVDITASVTLEFIRCKFVAQNILQNRVASIISFVDCSSNGIISVSKSDLKITNCQLNGAKGIALELFESNCNIKGTTFTGSSSVAISARTRSNLQIESSLFDKVQGTGILIHSFSTLKANNIRVTNCAKAGIILSNDANATISGSSITHCGNAGCEILSTSSLELNEVWISDTSGSGILCDQRSKIYLTRCRITQAKRNGIEAGNCAVARISDTMIDSHSFSGIIATNAKINGVTCVIQNNKDSNMAIDDHSWVELTNCQFLRSTRDGLIADSESMVQCNNCFFLENEGRGVIIKNCRDSKFQQSSFYDNKQGGLLFENTKQMVVDNCVVNKNSLIINNVGNAIVRLCALYAATTKNGNNPREFIEIRNKSKAIFEENRITRCETYVRKAEVNLRQNFFSMSPTFAIVGEYFAKINIESNEFNKDHQILSLKDNSYVHCFNNKMSNIIRPKGIDEDDKIKAIHIKTFSEGFIEGNMISGDYDYAVFIDGQSKVDNRANQIQCGVHGGICYSGVSCGLCEDNSYTGNTQHSEIFSHGCSPTRR